MGFVIHMNVSHCKVNFMYANTKRWNHLWKCFLLGVLALNKSAFPSATI